MKNNLEKDINEVEKIQQNEISFASDITKEVEKEIENEKTFLENYNKEKEVLKNGIMNKIFFNIFGKLIKKLKFGCYVKYNDKIIWSYEFPNK